MCMGIPMRVLTANEFTARCKRDTDCEDIDLSLVGPVAAGDWLLVFAGTAREILSPVRAADILDALALLDAVMNGKQASQDAYDKVLEAPKLPPHLQAELDARKI